MKKDSSQYFSVSPLEPSGLVPDFLVKKQLAKSKSEVKREVEKGGLYINNKRVTI